MGWPWLFEFGRCRRVLSGLPTSSVSKETWGEKAHGQSAIAFMGTPDETYQSYTVLHQIRLVYEISTDRNCTG